MDKKAVIIVSIVFAFIVAVLLGFMILTSNLVKSDTSQEPDEKVTILELSSYDYKLEIGDEVPNLKNFVKHADYKKDVEIVGEVNKDATGVYEIKYTLIKFNKTYEAELKVSVIDTKSPELALKDVNIVQGEDVDVNAFIESVKDKSEVKTTFAEEFDSASIGTHLVKVVATDLSGNKTVKEAKLNVTSKEETKQESGSNGSGGNDNGQPSPSPIPSPAPSPSPMPTPTPGPNPSPGPVDPPTPQGPTVGDVGTVASAIASKYPSMSRDGSLDAQAQACANQSASNRTISCGVAGAHGKQGTVLSLLTNFNLSKSSYGVGVAVFDGVNYIIVIEK